MTPAYIGLGSNLADRKGALAGAVASLHGIPRTHVVGVSSLYEAAPVGDPGLAAFLNAAVKLETGLGAGSLLEQLLRIEREWGRGSAERHRDRVLDLDLLAFGDAVIDEPGLIVPHPRLAWRPFVLVPLIEIEPAWRHPRTGATAISLIESFPARGDVRWTGPLGQVQPEPELAAAKA